MIELGLSVTLLNGKFKMWFTLLYYNFNCCYIAK